MAQPVMEIPEPNSDDAEAVATALETAAVFGAQGDAQEALRWVRRAAELASDEGNDVRALMLARTVADLTTHLQSVPAPAPVAEPIEVSPALRPAQESSPPAPPPVSGPIVVPPAAGPPPARGSQPPPATAEAAPAGAEPKSEPDTEREPPPPPPPPRPRQLVAVESNDATDTLPENAPITSRMTPPQAMPAAAAFAGSAPPSSGPISIPRPFAPNQPVQGAPTASVAGAPRPPLAVQPPSPSRTASAQQAPDTVRGPYVAASVAPVEAPRDEAGLRNGAPDTLSETAPGTSVSPATTSRARTAEPWDDRTVRYDQVMVQGTSPAELERAHATQTERRLESVAPQVAPAARSNGTEDDADASAWDDASDRGRKDDAARDSVSGVKAAGIRQAVRVSIAAYPGAPGFYVVRPLEDHQVPGQGAQEALVVLLGSGSTLFEAES